MIYAYDVEQRTSTYRANDKVYHFSIGLLFVFVAVLLLLNSKTAHAYRVGTFSLLENGFTLSPLQLHNHTDSDWLHWSLFLYYRFCYDSFKKLLHRQSWHEWYWKISKEVDTVHKTAVFLLTCKADQGKKSSGFRRFIIKWKRTANIRCEITLGKYQDQLFTVGG